MGLFDALFGTPPKRKPRKKKGVAGWKFDKSDVISI